MSDFFVPAKDRSASRRTVRLGCEVVRTRDYHRVGTRIVDVSTRGLQVLAEDDLSLGDSVEVFFRVPFSAIHVLVEGTVARVIRGVRRGDDGPAYGIRLAALQQDAHRALAAAALRFPPTLPFRPKRIDYAATIRAIGEC